MKTIVACGALAVHVKAIAKRLDLDVQVQPLPALLHNRPELIAPAVEEALQGREVVAVAYADCGTYGALDELCRRSGAPRLGGSHCYDVYAGVAAMQATFAAEPGTYVLTDFLVRSFRRSVVVELGLDRFPELRDDYFGNYRRVVWLAQHPTEELSGLARSAAESLGLPLEIQPVGDIGLERELERLLTLA